MFEQSFINDWVIPFMVHKELVRIVPQIVALFKEESFISDHDLNKFLDLLESRLRAVYHSGNIIYKINQNF